MILIIKHISIEGPGTIGEFFKSTTQKAKTIELDNGDRLPENLADIQAIIILGGPMNVYEEDKFPFLKDENAFLKKALEEKVPILGICLGAQLLAKACGAKVKKAKEKEIGWYKVSLIKEGRKDSFFDGLDKELDAFQWHEDTFGIPEAATLLATSDSCKNQAFRIGNNAYGLQFHIEVTDSMIEDWIEEYLGSSSIELQLKGEQILIDYHGFKEKFDKQANKIYFNFSKVIADKVRT